ncbi:MAG: hypothetical protein ACU0GG_16450 [Paracoccaceae bacterium]
MTTAQDDYHFTTANGLLTSVTANSTDAAPAIVTAAADGVTALIRAAGPRTSSASGLALADRVIKIDALEMLHRHIDEYTVTVTPLDRSLTWRIENHVRDRASCQGASVCVALLTPVKVKVGFQDSKSSVEEIVAVVDPTRSIGIRFNRTACAQSQNAATFNNGIMTDYDVDRPSEVASCLSIPLKILQTIISAPVEAITGRKERLDAEKELLAAEIAVLQQRNELVAAQNAAANDTTN